MERPDLRKLPAALRVLGAAFLLSLGIAYAVALLFVFVQSEMKPGGITEQFRGTPEVDGTENAVQDGADQGSPDQEVPAPAEDAIGEDGTAAPGLREEWARRNAGMTFPKSLKEMILTTHLHLLSISTILFLVGGIFALSSFPERAKPWVIASGFSALVLTYASMWAVRYLGSAFSAGVFVFGLLQATAMATQILAGLRDLLVRRPAA